MVNEQAFKSSLRMGTHDVCVMCSGVGSVSLRALLAALPPVTFRGEVRVPHGSCPEIVGFADGSGTSLSLPLPRGSSALSLFFRPGGEPGASFIRLCWMC